jgi:iron(III) transport system substrate-binding protein
VQAQARVEGRALLYSDAARAITAAEGFMSTYAGLDVEAYTLDSYDTYLRLMDDSQRGESGADVYMVSDAPRTVSLVAQKRLWNYVPAELVGVLSDTMRTPLLTHHWSAVTLIANSAQPPKPPVDNWWDLTRPEWRGRVALPDPILDERTLYLFVTLTQHAEELGQAYRAKFGRELVLDADCPNAGYQWIKQLLANQPVLLPGDAEVARLVGDPKADKPWLGLCGSEQYAKVRRGDLAFAMLPEVAPAAGMRWRTYVAIVDQAPHLNVAKLLVRWLMGDKAGQGGYAPWMEPGVYPARSDVPDPAGALPRQQLEPRVWDVDPVYILANKLSVRDHIAAHIGRPVGGR